MSKWDLWWTSLVALLSLIHLATFPVFLPIIVPGHELSSLFFGAWIAGAKPAGSFPHLWDPRGSLLSFGIVCSLVGLPPYGRIRWGEGAANWG